MAGRYPVDSGTAELVADADRFGGWLLSVDGTAQSYVDLLDPTHLEFDYVRQLGDLVDVLAPPGRPVRAVHLGGGAATLPRYVLATRPGSRQVVVEADAALVALVRRELGLPRAPALRVRVGDARAELATLPDASAELVVTDAFRAAAVPAHLTSAEFLADVARVLRPGGTYAANLVDGRPLGFARAAVATVRAALDSVLVVAAPGVLAGRRWGNLVVVGARGALPLEELRARVGRGAFPARVLGPDEVASFTAGAPVVTDRTAVDSRPIMQAQAPGAARR